MPMLISPAVAPDALRMPPRREQAGSRRAAEAHLLTGLVIRQVHSQRLDRSVF